MSEVIRADVYDIISDKNIPWNELRDSTVLVTGATGLIGGALVRALASANAEYNLNLRLIGHGRNRDKGEAIAQEFDLEFFGGDIRRPSLIADVTDRLDYIFHCAAITKSSDMVAKPAEVITTMVDGTRNMLELSRKKLCRSFVYLSSMEIYGRIEKRELNERDVGWLDLSNPRSSYPESKRFCETLCVEQAAQRGFPVKIARLALTFGAGAPNDENDMRVANQFARKALANEDIELHTMGNSIANCCYISDAVRGLLTVLLKGKNGEAYNVVNTSASATIREMAELVADEVCGGRIKVVVNVPEDIQKRGYAPDVGYTLNADKLKALGWVPKYGLGEMYKRMLADWQGLNLRFANTPELEYSMGYK